MKKLNLQFYVLLALYYFVSGIQVSMAQAGGSAAGFGINSTLYSNTTFSSGAPIPPVGTIDWFKGSSGRNVVDQTSPSTIQSLLQGATVNPTYIRRLNGAVNGVADGTFGSGVYQRLIDAVWARDEFGGSGGTDQTGLGIGSKNGQGPELWSATSGSVLGKNDLIDVAGHMFRDVNTSLSKNNLWFVGLINRAEPNGDAYMDFEFFIKDVAYSPGTGFTSGGDDLGHTAFQFDGSGNFSRMGDMLYNMSLTNGGTTVEIEVRIWVSYADYTGVTPTTFNWGPFFDGPVNGSPYGYASIIPKSPGGMMGFVNSAGQLPTAPPWGARTTKSNSWVTQYSEYSIAEMGLNLTSLGLDDYLLSGTNPCNFSWRTFMVKTRSSASFTAALKDFAGPYTWGKPTVAIEASNATINCSNPTATLTPNPVFSDATFSWTTADGHIVGSTTSTSIQVDQPGSYILTATLSSGCTIQSPPFVVTSGINLISAATTTATIACGGNDGTVNLTVVGGTAPFTYSWAKVGDPSFTATTQNISGLTPGSYVVTINYGSGCTYVSNPAVVPSKTPIGITPAITHVNCNGENNGAISLTVTGKSPFSYLWSNGKTSKDLVNIAAGSYSVTVTDADGCQNTANINVTQPTVLSAVIVKTNDTDPSAVKNGSIDLQVSGGSPAYTYLWSTGATTEDISGIGYGNYSVTITDAHGCTATTSCFIYEPEICDDGIDNDGDGLTNCQDSDCKPAKPGSITADDLIPCLEQTVTYSVTNNPAVSYVWTLPSGASLLSGAGTNSITLKWTNVIGGQVCVQASRYTCVSDASCISVTPHDVPPAPATILKN
jgi:hypothetical protein